MPYIKGEQRKDLEIRGIVPRNSGELNYILHLEIEAYVNEHGKSYQTFNDIIGALECVKQEIYRRKIAPYENLKEFDNGNINFYKEL